MWNNSLYFYGVWMLQEVLGRIKTHIVLIYLIAAESPAFLWHFTLKQYVTKPGETDRRNNASR